MAIPARTAPMSSDRRTALLGGGLYLVTFASSIPAAFYFLDPVLSDPGYVLGPGADTRVLVGGFLDVVNAFACIGTAVVLFRVLKRQNETLALGFVTARVLEAAIIAVGVVSLFAVVTLRQDLAGPPERTRRTDRRRVGARRGPRLDVPARPRRHGGRERPAAGHADVPVRPRAAGHPAHGPRRSARCCWPPKVAIDLRRQRRHHRCGRWSRSPRSSSGSCRSASSWPSRASGPRPSPPCPPPATSREQCDEGDRPGAVRLARRPAVRGHRPARHRPRRRAGPRARRRGQPLRLAYAARRPVRRAAHGNGRTDPAEAPGGRGRRGGGRGGRRRERARAAAGGRGTRPVRGRVRRVRPRRGRQGGAASRPGSPSSRPPASRWRGRRRCARSATSEACRPGTGCWSTAPRAASAASPSRSPRRSAPR